ncbi:MAG: hypothetical protein U5R06_04135 [candidate division KSB1 bacterium]|nr:hypothetical protein [candidate division KSB1 bacterium]
MTGTGFVPGDNVRLLVISDVDTVFDGMGYADVSGGIETATINGDGSLPPTLVWTPPVTGGYDVVVDTEPFSEYNEGDAVSDVLLQGLVVQEPASEEDIFIDIASDEFGIHKSQFDSLDAIFATVCPYRQSLYNVNRDYWNTPGSENYRSNRSPMVWTPIAVTLHQEVWEAGDPIYTIRTVGTMQMTTNLQLNHRTSCVPTVRIRGACKPKYMNPLKLWPGPYDMIVDVNGNDVYDPGIDYLDGGSPGPGFTIPGELLPSDSVRIIATTDDDFVGRQFGTTKINIKVFNNLLQGHENVEIRVSVVIGPGRVIPGPSGSFKDKYGYLHLFTNEDGYVWCEFTDGQFGVMSRVRLEFYIDGKLYWQVVSLDQTTPHTHTQGIIIHDQGSGS